jgi:hypothetical protein
MSAENPWEDAPRAVLEQQLMAFASRCAKLMSENTALEQAVTKLVTSPPPLPLGRREAWPASPADSMWYVGLVMKLQDLLARECGRRDPAHIDNHTLRALTEHILEGSAP